MTKNSVFSIPYSCVRLYKGDTFFPLEIRVEEHHKVVILGHINKSRIAHRLW